MTKKKENETKKGRREALKTIALGAGGLTTLPILGQAQSVGAVSETPGTPAAADAEAQPEANWKPQFFDDHQNETLIALTDLIIPNTDTPGAKVALVNRCIDLWYYDQRAELEQKVVQAEGIIQALSWFDGRSISLHKKAFVGLTKQEQTAILEPLADPTNKNPDDQPGVKAFELIKELTIFGYYTSKIGLEEELKYQGDTYNASFPGACTHPEHQS